MIYDLLIIGQAEVHCWVSQNKKLMKTKLSLRKIVRVIIYNLVWWKKLIKQKQSCYRLWIAKMNLPHFFMKLHYAVVYQFNTLSLQLVISAVGSNEIPDAVYVLVLTTAGTIVIANVHRWTSCIRRVQGSFDNSDICVGLSDALHRWFWQTWTLGSTTFVRGSLHFAILPVGWHFPGQLTYHLQIPLTKGPGSGTAHSVLFPQGKNTNCHRTQLCVSAFNAYTGHSRYSVT